MHISYQDMRLSYTDITQKTALDNSKNPYTQEISIQKCKAEVVASS